MRNADLKNHDPLSRYNRACGQIDLQGVAAPRRSAELSLILSTFCRCLKSIFKSIYRF